MAACRSAVYVLHMLVWFLALRNHHARASDAADLSSNVPQQASQWTSHWECVTSSPDVTDTWYYAIRLTASWDVECSMNADLNKEHYEMGACAGFHTIEECTTYASGKMQGIRGPDKFRTLVCGHQHATIWGAPGYSDPSHWCERGYQTLLANVHAWPTCTCKHIITSQQYMKQCTSRKLRGQVCECFCTIFYLIESLNTYKHLAIEYERHMIAWELFSSWYEALNGEPPKPTDLATYSNANSHQEAKSKGRGRRSLLQGSEIKTLGSFWVSQPIKGGYKLSNDIKPLLIKDLSGPTASRPPSQCKSIAKSYTFTGPKYSPPSECNNRQDEENHMYLTISPDCRVKVESEYVYPSTGEKIRHRFDTEDLDLGIPGVACFGAHFALNPFWTHGGHFYEINSKGEMRHHVTQRSCSGNCLPADCSLTWTTDDWPDCTWAMRIHTLNEGGRRVLEAGDQILGRIGGYVANNLNKMETIVTDMMKKLRDNEYKVIRTDSYSPSYGPKRFFKAKDGVDVVLKRTRKEQLTSKYHGDSMAAAQQADMEFVVKDITTGWRSMIKLPTEMFRQVEKELNWPVCWGACFQAAGDDIESWAGINGCTERCVDLAKYNPW